MLLSIRIEANRIPVRQIRSHRNHVPALLVLLDHRAVRVGMAGPEPLDHKVARAAMALLDLLDRRAYKATPGQSVQQAQAIFLTLRTGKPPAP